MSGGCLAGLPCPADGAGGDAAEGGEVVDCDAGATRAFDLAEDRPLPDDFGVSRHVEILPP